MRVHLKFAGARKGENSTIKGVEFKNGVCDVEVPNAEHAAGLISYLGTFQALPVDQADKLQAKLDKAEAESKDILLAKARAEKAESESIELRAKVLMLEQKEEKEKAGGQVSTDAPPASGSSEQTEGRKTADRPKSNKGGK